MDFSPLRASNKNNRLALKVSIFSRWCSSRTILTRKPVRCIFRLPLDER